MGIERLVLSDIRHAVVAARLMLSSGDGRRSLCELLGTDEASLWELDDRLKQWLDGSHLDGGGGLN